MTNHILVCGLNGSGKSTFAKALAERLDYTFKDIENYYFPNLCAGYPYTDPQSRDFTAAQAVNLFFTHTVYSG
ncbi:MAG: AAA family ATPase [Clostridia bacterium]|nr:AAA family ATPase [Clostridia bacterium]